MAKNLIQIFLPVKDNNGRAFSHALFEVVESQLTHQFGGMTAFTRSPGEGLWKDGTQGVYRDDIVILEVITSTLDPEWWQSYRKDLQRLFQQNTILIRSSEIEVL
jgi:hypothetical protein